MTTATRVWLTSADLAARLQVPVKTVEKWRYEGTGPQGVRFGRHVRYLLSAVEVWESEQAAKAS